MAAYTLRSRHLSFGTLILHLSLALCTILSKYAVAGSRIRYSKRTSEFQSHRNLQVIQTSGDLNVLVLLMQFSDHQDDQMIPAPTMNRFFNDDNSDANLYPTGSLRTYMQVISHQQLTIRATVIPWYVVPNTETECSFGSSGLDPRFAECFAPILEALDEVHTLAENPFQWQNFDRNGDGFIDSLVVMHSGMGAEYGGDNIESRIWSHSSAPPTDPWQSSVFDVQLGNYAVTSAFFGNEQGSNSSMARIGPVAHQLLNTFGLQDLYDETNGLGSFQGGAGVYSVMSNPWTSQNSSFYPGHLDPWSKIQLGWISPAAIEVDGNYTLNNAEDFAEVYLIDDPYPEGEYLLIENRQQLQFDLELPGTGVLIWHIDDTVQGNSNPGYPSQDGWPQNGNHYQVAVLQADGLFDLEQNINQGDGGDFFVPGRGVGPGFNDFVPNTDSYQNGTVIQTGIVISGFVLNDTVMTFQVTGVAEATDTLPSSFPTIKSEEHECLVNVNVNLCNEVIMDAEVVEECGCYNFCPNGMAQTCSPVGIMPIINCQEGPLIAGCRMMKDASPSLNETAIDLTEAINPEAMEEGEIGRSHGERADILQTQCLFIASLFAAMAFSLM